MSIMDDPLSGILFFCNQELIDQHMFQDIVVTKHIENKIWYNSAKNNETK